MEHAKSSHQASLTELTKEMDAVEGFLLYWLTVEDPDILEEAADRIAELENDLASLKMEHKTRIEDKNQQS
ncbi:MAG: hypothetical protein EOO61_10115 [Hymenobacter sp.]|nr:MAG: hypothetical protein EOO61_10115 [Hymenobacter sp.]